MPSFLLASTVLLFSVTAAVAQVVINEIMPDPLPGGSTSGGEYIELLNISDSVVAIADWKIVDGTGKVQGTLPSFAPQLQPHDYVVIAGDSSFGRSFPLNGSSNVILLNRSSGLGLNNDGDDVMIVAVDGRTIDSLHYDGSWHLPWLGDTRGLSLERISGSGMSSDPRNWSTCADPHGGTPGSTNSIAIPIRTSSGELSVDPGTVLPDHDGRLDFVRISWRLPVATARIRLAIYDLHGFRRRLLIDNEPAGPEGETVFDGRDDDGMSLGIGVYIARVEWIDGSDATNAAHTGVVIGP